MKVVTTNSPYYGRAADILLCVCVCERERETETETEREREREREYTKRVYI